MKIKFQALILLLLYLFTNGCQSDGLVANPDSQEKLSIPINLEEVIEKPFEDLFEDIRFIPLQTTAASVFHDMARFTFSKDHFYIFSNPNINYKALIIFDRSGKFINKIEGSTTRGAGSFHGGIDIAFEERNNCISILDRVQKRIVQFDAQGNFLQELPISEEMRAIAPLSKKKYIGYKGNAFEFVSDSPQKNNLFYLDENGQVIQPGFYTIRDYLTDHYIYRKEFHKSFRENTYFFTEVFNPVVYEISDQYFIPRYEVAFKQNWVPVDKLQELANLLQQRKIPDYQTKMLALLGGAEINKIDLVGETAKTLVLVYNYNSEGKRKVVFTLYDKAQQQNRSFSIKGEPSNLFSFLKTIQVVGTEGTKMYFAINRPYRLNEYIKEHKIEVKDALLQDILSKITESSNPILVEAKIKTDY